MKKFYLLLDKYEKKKKENFVNLVRERKKLKGKDFDKVIMKTSNKKTVIPAEIITKINENNNSSALVKEEKNKKMDFNFMQKNYNNSKTQEKPSEDKSEVNNLKNEVNSLKDDIKDLKVLIFNSRFFLNK